MTSALLFAGQTTCLRFVPATPFRDLYAALVCGVNLEDGEVKRLFVDAGLIHILVVSGAHLVTLERLTRRGPGVVTAGLLGAYAWLTGFGAPVVRALVARALRGSMTKRGFGPLQLEFATSAVVVAAYPPWVGSRSFLMSWLCVLALKSPGPRTRAPWLLDGLRCYVFLYLFCLAHPLTVAWNCVVAPVIGGALFPAAAAAFVLPGATFVVDGAWRALLWLLHAGPRAGAEGAMIQTAWLWWVPWVAHASVMYVEWAWRRVRAFS